MSLIPHLLRLDVRKPFVQRLELFVVRQLDAYKEGVVFEQFHLAIRQPTEAFEDVEELIYVTLSGKQRETLAYTNMVVCGIVCGSGW